MTLMFQRLAIALIAAVLMTFVSAPIVSASHTGNWCDHAKLTVWEDWYFGGDGLVICYGANISNLANVPHTQAGTCNGYLNADHWGDCISSGKFREFATNTTVCLYRDTNYGYLLLRLTSDGQSFNAAFQDDFNPFNDRISSIRWDC